MCCFKVFRLVRDFIRHAQQHDDAGEIKFAYIKNTCAELRELSDKQLHLAMRQFPSAAEGKKRTWLAAFGSQAFGSQTAATHTGFGKSDVAAMDQTHLRANNSSDPLNRLDPASIEPLAPLNPLTTQFPTAQPHLASMPTSMISSSCLDNSTQSHPYAMEGQAREWEEEFDAPVLQLMNSIPIWKTWEPENPGAANPDAQAGPYQGS